MNKNFNHLIKSNITAALLLVLLSFAAYSVVLDSTFKTMDDEVSIVRNENIRSFSNIGKVFTSSFFLSRSFYRPMVALSFTADYHLFGLNASFYYLVNILLHAAMAVSVFFLIKALCGERGLAFLTALVYTVHPVHWEAVSNIPGRSILLCGLFYVNAFTFFLVSGQNKKSPQYLLSAVLFVFALLSKESAIMFPVLIFTYLLMVKEGGMKGAVNAVKAVWPFAAVNVVYIIIRSQLNITNIGPGRPLEAVFFDVLTFLRTVITHVRVTMLPTGLYYYRLQETFTTVFDGEVLFTAVMGLFFIYVFWRMRKKMSALVSFMAVWFFIELFPVAQILARITSKEGYISAADHFLYVPLISLLFIFILIFKRIYERVSKYNIMSTGVFNFTAVCLVLFLFLTTVQLNVYARNETAMLQRSLEFLPGNARVRNSLALSYAKTGRFKEAEKHFRLALKSEPNNTLARIGLGKSLIDQKRYWEGILEYEKIGDAGQFSEILAGNLRAAYPLIIEQYRGLIAAEPGNPQAHYSLGVVYAKQLKIKEAVAAFKKAVSLNPEYKNALFNLGSILDTSGDYDQAVLYYEKIAALDGAKNDIDYRVLIRLGEIFEHKGKTKQAEKYFTLAKEHNEMIQCND